MRKEETKHKWILPTYIITIASIIAIAYSGILPKEIEKIVTEEIPGVSGKIIPMTQEYKDAVIALNSFTAQFSLGFSLLGTLILSRKRNIFEGLAIFFTGMLPRERKYWGRVVDQKTGKPIAFAPIRILSIESEGNHKILVQTISDLDGRYRLYISSTSKVKLEAAATGYEPYSKEVTKQATIGDRIEIVEDIFLKKTGIDISKSDWTKTAIQNFYYYILPFTYIFLFYFIYINTLKGFLFGIFAALNNPVVINIIFFIVYTISVVWNTIIVIERLRFNGGKVIDAKTKLPVTTALVQLFNENGLQGSALSDETGLIKFDLKQGKYYIQISATNYKTVLASLGKKVWVSINKEGYLTKNLELERSGDNKTINYSFSSLPNPFG